MIVASSNRHTFLFRQVTSLTSLSSRPCSSMSKPPQDSTDKKSGKPSVNVLKEIDSDKDKAMNLQDIRSRLFQTKDDLSERLTSWWSGSAKRNGDTEWYLQRVSFWMKRYENFVGLTEVKAAQAKVVESERAFIDMQNARRDAQIKIRDVQERIKQIHTDLEKTHRGEDRYLTLVTQEHQILKEERTLLAEFESHERKERDCFNILSKAVRDSHEQERAQAEKTKYWSVIGSIIGTCIGILGTTINNRMRMRELRDLVAKSSSGERLNDITDNLGKSLDSHEDRLKELVTQIQHVMTDSKLSLDRIGEMRAVADKLNKTADKFNIKEFASVASDLSKRTNEVFQTITNQQRAMQNVFADFLQDLRGQNDHVVQALGGNKRDLEALLRISDSRDKMLKASFESLYKNQTNLLLAFDQRSSSSESKVDNVLSVLNSLQSAAAARKDKENSLLQNLDASLIDKIELALDEHESRLKAVMVSSGFVVAIATPLILYAINKFV